MRERRRPQAPGGPLDGKPETDTYEGWLARGRQVVIGAHKVTPRRLEPARDAGRAVFEWRDTMPVAPGGAKAPSPNTQAPGDEDEIPFD